MSGYRKKPGLAFWATVVGLAQLVGYYVLALVIVFVLFALSEILMHGWPYYGP